MKLIAKNTTNNNQALPVLTFLTPNNFKKLFTPSTEKIFNYLLKKILFSQPESLVEQKESNIQVTKEFLEQWVVQGLNLTPKGAGNYPIDAYRKDSFGVDVKFVSITSGSNKMTNETSIIQNFESGGNSLDSDFQSLEYNKILDKWISLLTEKYKKVESDLNLKKIYYFLFIRNQNTINLAVAELDVKAFKNLAVNQVKAINNTNAKSISIKNFIEDNYGNTKIYKSKKRMELRLNFQELAKNNLLFVMNFNSSFSKDNQINLSDIISDNDKFNAYLKQRFNDIFLIK